jgi:hypothetical protein
LQAHVNDVIMAGNIYISCMGTRGTLIWGPGAVAEHIDTYWNNHTNWDENLNIFRGIGATAEQPAMLPKWTVRRVDKNVL